MTAPGVLGGGDPAQGDAAFDYLGEYGPGNEPHGGNEGRPGKEQGGRQSPLDGSHDPRPSLSKPKNWPKSRGGGGGGGGADRAIAFEVLPIQIFR